MGRMHVGVFLHMAEHLLISAQILEPPLQGFLVVLLLIMQNAQAGIIHGSLQGNVVPQGPRENLLGP